MTPLRYDVRFSLDERRSTRPSYESVRPSLDYARRGRQSADVSRSKPVNRVSFDVAHRFSLDPALVELGETRAARGPKSVKGPLEGCVLYLHGVKDAELERGAKAAGEPSFFFFLVPSLTSSSSFTCFKARALWAPWTRRRRT